MNRKLLIVMMLTTVLAAEGCRRGGEKKPPLSVEKESDFLYTRRENAIGAGIEPKPKQPTAAALSPEAQKAAQAAEALAKKLKEEADKIKRRDDTAALGAWLRAYRSANPAPVYTSELVLRTLRRENRLSMYDDVDKGAIDVPYLVDPSNPGHIVCYHKTIETQEDFAAKKTVEVGHPAFFADGRAGFVKSTEVGQRIKEQQMLVCWYYYVQFATPYFYRTSAEFGSYVPNLLNQPPLFLNRIKVKAPELIKMPPDPRTPERFRKHLEENAPPQLFTLIAKNDLCVSLTADLWMFQEPIACRSTPEGKDENQKEKGHMVIDARGFLAYYPIGQAKQWLEKNKLKFN